MLVFVDGENFRRSLITVLSSAGFCFNDDIFQYDVAGLLRDVLSTNDLTIMYYSSQIRPPVGYEPCHAIKRQLESIRKRKRYWASTLANQGIQLIHAGNLKVKMSKPCPNCRYTGEHLQEKGVDVRLAIDIFENALSSNMAEIAVFSSDTDICPVYHRIRAKGVKVRYICFASVVNRAVSAATDETLTISPEKASSYVKLPMGV